MHRPAPAAAVARSRKMQRPAPAPASATWCKTTPDPLQGRAPASQKPHIGGLTIPRSQLVPRACCKPLKVRQEKCCAYDFRVWVTAWGKAGAGELQRRERRRWSRRASP